MPPTPCIGVVIRWFLGRAEFEMHDSSTKASLTRFRSECPPRDSRDGARSEVGMHSPRRRNQLSTRDRLGPGLALAGGRGSVAHPQKRRARMPTRNFRESWGVPRVFRLAPLVPPSTRARRRGWARVRRMPSIRRRRSLHPVVPSPERSAFAGRGSSDVARPAAPRGVRPPRMLPSAA
jgi:hypothetical protein